MATETRIRHGIRWKLLTTMIGLLVGLLTILTFIQILGQKRIMERDLEALIGLMRTVLSERGRTLSDNLARQTANDVASFNFSNIGEVIGKAVSDDRELDYAILMDAAATAYIHTAKPQLQQETLTDARARFALDQTATAVNEFKEGDRSFMEFVVPIVIGTDKWGVLRLGFSLHLLNEQIAKSRDEIASEIRLIVLRTTVMSLVFIAAGSLVVRWLATHLSRPLSSLTESAAQLARGNFEVADQVAVESRDEVGVLAAEFIDMSRKLRQSYAELEDLNRNLAEKVEERTAELAEMTHQAEEAQAAAEDANQTKSAFLASMSHELRTPLNAIIGYSEMLEEDCEDLGQEDFIPDLKKIQSAGRHLLDLINEVLDLSKIEAGKIELIFETVEVAPVIDEIVSTIQPLIAKNANALDLQVAGNCGSIETDVPRLRQCVFNLLSNASKFTEKGTIGLHVSRNSIGGVDWLDIRVRDTGIGMTPEQLSRIFEAFSQADVTTTRKYGGTGLGLTITRRICQMMGGEITAQSTVGEGSTFTIILPAVRRPAALAEGDGAPDDAEHALPAAGSTVLVIDDDAEARDLMSRFLTKQGFHVATAADGEEGLRRAKELKPDAVTLDIVMPRMDGWAVLNAMKSDAELKDIPVVICSMADEQNMGFALGASDYVTKPIDREQLTEVLGKVKTQARGTHVLVVEDEPTTRTVMRRILEMGGWSVQEAENGKVALEELQRRLPDLIVLDLMMPEMDGFEFVGELQGNEEWRSIPVVVVTGAALKEEDSARLDGYVAGVLRKGQFTRERLVTIVRDLVETEPS